MDSKLFSFAKWHKLQREAQLSLSLRKYIRMKLGARLAQCGPWRSCLWHIRFFAANNSLTLHLSWCISAPSLYLWVAGKSPIPRLYILVCMCSFRLPHCVLCARSSACCGLFRPRWVMSTVQQRELTQVNRPVLFHCYRNM